MATWQTVETSVNLGFLLKEDGGYLLCEDGASKILLSFGRNAASNWTAISKSA